MRRISSFPLFIHENDFAEVFKNLARYTDLWTILLDLQNNHVGISSVMSKLQKVLTV